MNLLLSNPYVRYVGIMPGVMEGITMRRAFDCRLFYILEGEAVLSLPENEFPLVSGAAFYLPAGLPYNIDGNVKTIVLNFDFTLNATGRKSKSPLRADLFRESDLFDPSPVPEAFRSPIFRRSAQDTSPFFEECLSWKGRDGGNGDAVLSGLVKVLLGKMAECSPGEEPDGNGIAEKVMLYLKRNYDKNLNSETLSKEFGYHPYHLNRLFRQAYGKPIHQALTEERIRIARHLLTRTDLSVENISGIVGFSDRVSFFYAFRKVVGKSPARYREEP